MSLLTRLLIPALAALLAGCTAIKVVTHVSDGDPAGAPAGHYHLDPHHWSLLFDVDHLGFSRFDMRFDRVSADLDFDPTNPEQCRLTAVVQADSIDSNVPELDEMIRDEAMLDAAHYPEIRFVSRSLRRIDQANGEMTGDLTLHGETRPVTLQVGFTGGGRNPLTGEDTIGFRASGSIERSAFGLNRWYPAVGNRLELRIDAEFVKPR